MGVKFQIGEMKYVTEKNYKSVRATDIIVLTHMGMEALHVKALLEKQVFFPPENKPRYARDRIEALSLPRKKTDETFASRVNRSSSFSCLTTKGDRLFSLSDPRFSGKRRQSMSMLNGWR